MVFPTSLSSPNTSALLLLLLLLLLTTTATTTTSHAFEIEESTISDIRLAFNHGLLTSRQLVQYYLNRIQTLNPLLHAVIETNPDALNQADRADRERLNRSYPVGPLHGIPVLIKDNIATKDRLNTTAGSLALLGSVQPRDAGVVRRLRRAGAVILGKASLSEWSHFRSFSAPSGWSARGGQGKNPYVLSADPCGSSSGSAIAAAANMAAATVGTETDGSIVCPSASNSVVGIKPTVGLTSRDGVIPISPRQDTIGPICRTVSDAVLVLDTIAGYDKRDKATKKASQYISRGGYMQFLNVDGLKGKRLGILRKHFFNFPKDSMEASVYEDHFTSMRQQGAILVDNLEVANTSIIVDGERSGETAALLAEFKLSLNAYLSQLTHSPVRSLMDVIDFNNQHPAEERMPELGQTIFLAAQNTSGLDSAVKSHIDYMAELCLEGLERLMMEEKLDAIVTPGASAASLLAIGGYPGISVPAGYGIDGVPFGICFGGLKGSEPKLIEIAYAFEQATKIRKPPSLTRSELMI